MSDSSALPKTCPQCGTALPSDATEGLCPRCLMAEAMQPSQAGADDAMSAATMPVARPTGSIPRNDTPELPLPEELSALLPKGDYRVEGFLGQGGMGAVYKGVQVRLKRPVAIKIMRRDQGRDYDFEARFEREALAMAKLNHPNIVSVIDFGEAGPDYLYIVMELVDGADLMDVIRTGRMTQEMALSLLPQICDALQFAHDHGIVHRDIKPSNIMLTRDGRIKMADFGLAKRYDVESSFRTQTGTGMGTPDYAAPEQFKADAPIDHRADIYALGVMIYQMITGELPRGVWKPPSARSECHPHWDDIVSHAMQSDPADRYQQASEVKTDVSKITPSSEGRVASPKQPQPVRKSSRPRRPVAALILGLVAVATFYQATVFWSRVGSHVAFAPASPSSSLPASMSSPLAPAQTFAGHRYQFVPGNISWAGAKAKAEALGGHLATLTSKEEDDFVRATFADRLTQMEAGFWLGASEEKPGGGWHWVTGEKFDFTAWGGSFPFTRPDMGKTAPTALFFQRHEHSPKGAWTNYELSSPKHAVITGFVVEWDDAGSTSATTTVAAPKQTLDLIALVDVKRDRLKADGMAGANEWTKNGGQLAFVSVDKRGGKIGAPVALNGLRDYEVEVGVVNAPAGGVILDFPISATNQATMAFVPGEVVLVRDENQKLNEIGKWPKDAAGSPVKLAARVKLDVGGMNGTLSATVNGLPVGEWRGALGRLGRKTEQHPEFPGQFGPALYVPAGDIAYSSWTLRVFDGEAKVLRGGVTSGSSSSPGLPASSSPSSATKDTPFINSLGMKFVPVPITGGPTGGQRVLFSVWETRVQDYVGFTKETKRDWPREGMGFPQGPTHPAVMVSWEDAQAFCAWLTERERKAGRLGANDVYRLPSDHEWSCAVGIGEREDPAKTPGEKSWKIDDAFPWGNTWPPPTGAGNYAGEELQPSLSAGKYSGIGGVLTGYRDAWPETAPVGSFKPNGLGLYDLGGNAWEWCEDWFSREQKGRVLRGASWAVHDRGDLLASERGQLAPATHEDNYGVGFRCVLKISSKSDEHAAAQPSAATKDAPFVNSLGMKFVPVPITGGPTSGQRVLFGVWDTRVQDYEVFAKATKREWPKPDFEQGPTHPAVNVSWDDSTAFCGWLTNRERIAGRLGSNEVYRLPKDHEWSCAVGIGDKEDAAKTPEEKNEKIANVFPWGTQWPPPANSGNYWSEELRPLLAAGKHSWIQGELRDYRDGFATTSPVGSFAANRFGLFDMSGNVWQWCESWLNKEQTDHVLRGASWTNGGANSLLSSARHRHSPGGRSNMFGFRCVLAPVTPSAP